MTSTLPYKKCQHTSQLQPFKLSQHCTSIHTLIFTHTYKVEKEEVEKEEVKLLISKVVQSRAFMMKMGIVHQISQTFLF